MIPQRNYMPYYRHVHLYNLRRQRRVAQPLFRTKRFADSFVNRCVSEEIYSAFELRYYSVSL